MGSAQSIQQQRRRSLLQPVQLKSEVNPAFEVVVSKRPHMWRGTQKNGRRCQ